MPAVTGQAHVQNHASQQVLHSLHVHICHAESVYCEEAANMLLLCLLLLLLLLLLFSGCVFSGYIRYFSDRTVHCR